MPFEERCLTCKQVTEAQIHNDLALDKFMWDHPSARGTKSPRQDSVSVFSNAYEARALHLSKSELILRCQRRKI